MCKIWSICLIILLLFLCQCGQKPSNNYLLLVDGKHGLSRDIFMRNFQLNKDFRNRQSCKMEDIKDYIEKNFLPNFLLLAEGYTLSIDHDSTLQARLASQERRILTRSNGPLLNFILSDSSPIDSLELMKYYQQQNAQFKIAHILVKSRALADSLYSSLRQGADFGALAMHFSSDLQTADRRGEFFQEYVPGTMGLAFDSVCVTLSPGQISLPVKTNSGFHLIKLFQRFKRAQNPFNEERRRLELQLKRQKQSNLSDDYHQKLYKKYNLIIHRPMVALFPSIFQIDSISQLPRLDFKKLNETQLNAIIAQYSGGSITVAQVIEEYFISGRSGRIPLRRPDEVEDYIHLMVLEGLKYLDAKNLELDQTAEFKNEIETEKQQMIIKQARQRLINQKIQIEEAEIINYFQQHQNDFPGKKYEEVQILIKNTLQGKKYMAELDNLNRRLRKKFKVEYNDELLKTVVDEIKQLSGQLKNKTDQTIPLTTDN